MTIDVEIGDKELQYDINREASKLSALSQGKNVKCKYLAGEDILPSHKTKQQKKLNLLILLFVKLLKNK